MTARAGQAGTDRQDEAAPPGMARFLPLVVVASAAAAFWLFGLERYVSIAAIVDHRDDLVAAIAGQPLLCALAFGAAYAACVAISFPGASLLTIAGGALFGTLLGGTLAVVAATIGAAIVFAVARSSFGEGLARRAGPFIARFAAGFERDAFAYLLSLRLAPVFPFWLVNLAPALVGVGFRTHMLSTVIGIIPGTFAYAAVGAGLDSVIAKAAASRQACLAAGGATCEEAIDVGSLVTPQIGIALFGLAVVALIPVVLKAWRRRAA